MSTCQRAAGPVNRTNSSTGLRSMHLTKPYRDELIGSVLARELAYSGLGTKRFLHSLLGRHTCSVSYFMPTQLPLLARAMTVSPKVLLWDHTVFPYVTAFTGRDEATRLESKALTSNGNSGLSLSSLVGSVTRSVKALRFCPACAEQELATLGETYWHRSHNLPATLLCHEHGLQLFEVKPVNWGGAIALGQPHHLKASRVLMEVPSSLALSLARGSHQLLSASARCEPSIHLKQYRERALEMGYALAGGFGAGRELSNSLAMFYGPRLLNSLSSQIRPDSLNPWPGLMLRVSSKEPFSAVKHLLLRMFLSAHTAPTELSVYRRPGKVARDYADLDQTLAKQLATKLRATERAGARISIAELSRDISLWASYRHHPDRFPESRAVLSAYRKSDQAERQEGRRPYWRRRLGLEEANDASSGPPDDDEQTIGT